MKEALTSTIFFGAALTLIAYNIGLFLNKKFKLIIFNPLLVSSLLVILLLVSLDIDYEHYALGADYIGYLLTPATVCLALPLYEEWAILKKNWKAILSGILVGVVSNAMSVLPLVMYFKLSHIDYVTLLPKSITAAFGMSVSAELGGVVPITVIVIILTGLTGSIVCEKFFKLIKIKDPIAKGVALGTASHAMGTARAFELGEVEGAISSLSLALSGLITVILISGFVNLY